MKIKKLKELGDIIKMDILNEEIASKFYQYHNKPKWPISIFIKNEGWTENKLTEVLFNKVYGSTHIIRDGKVYVKGFIIVTGKSGSVSLVMDNQNLLEYCMKQLFRLYPNIKHNFLNDLP